MLFSTSSRQAARLLCRRAATASLVARSFSFTPNPIPNSASSSQSTSTPKSSSKKPISSEPLPYNNPPIFPPPKDPFDGRDAVEEAGSSQQQYSESTKTLVRGVARLMGYNSKASTAIRETQRMMRGIVEAVERDRAFWYDECRLPSTYQSFFQLHLLYVLILLPRLRALPAGNPPGTKSHPIPEPVDPSPPQDPPGSPDAGGSGAAILSKPNYDSYPTEFLSHFFEMTEGEMRSVLGRGERERVVKKYMEEMAEQWKGAGIGLDYVLGLSSSEKPEERELADVELASWVWRNLFASRGLNSPTPGGSGVEAVADDGDMAEKLELVVRFVRREMERLDQIDQVDVLNGDVGEFGSVRS